MNVDQCNRTKIIKARVNEFEESLVKAKAKIYGYKNLSKYLIDAAVYEKVTCVDVENKDLIYRAYAQNTKELKKIVKELRNITKYGTMMDVEITQKINVFISNIMRIQDSMLKLIDEKLSLKVWQQIQHEKKMEE